MPFHRIKLKITKRFTEGIRRDDEATDKFINDPAEPTFENTIARVDTEKGEHYYDLLSRVSNVFSCMMSAETCDEMEALAQKLVLSSPSMPMTSPEQEVIWKNQVCTWSS